MKIDVQSDTLAESRDIPTAGSLDFKLPEDVTPEVVTRRLGFKELGAVSQSSLMDFDEGAIVTSGGPGELGEPPDWVDPGAAKEGAGV